jgi:hypothetical protein
VSEDKHQSTFVKLFGELLDQGCDEAAAGLLCDLFRFLHFAEVGWTPESQPDLRETDAWLREARRVHLREDIMQLLDDQDGGKLQELYRLYRHDPVAFREHIVKLCREQNDVHDSGLWLDKGREPKQS